MTGTDEAAEQAMAVEITGEGLDPPPPDQAPPFPIGARECNEPGRDQPVIGFDILPRLRLAEEAPWVWISSTVTYTANLDSVKGYEINPSNLLFALSKVTLGQ